MQAFVAAEGHGEVEFFLQDLQGAGDAGLAGCAQAPEEGAADVQAARAQGPGFEGVLAAVDAAVQVHFDLGADGFDDGRQGADAGGGAVELAAAVVAELTQIGRASCRERV